MLLNASVSVKDFKACRMSRARRESTPGQVTTWSSIEGSGSQSVVRQSEDCLIKPLHRKQDTENEQQDFSVPEAKRNLFSSIYRSLYLLASR